MLKANWLRQNNITTHESWVRFCTICDEKKHLKSAATVLDDDNRPEKSGFALISEGTSVETFTKAMH